MTRTRTLLVLALLGLVGLISLSPQRWPVLGVLLAALVASGAVLAQHAREQRRAAEASWTAFEREFWTYVERRARPSRRKPGA